MDTIPTPTEPTLHEKIHSWLTVPIAVIIAGAMVSGSVLYAGSPGGASVLKTAGDPTVAVSGTPTPIADPKTLFGPDDAALGNANAKVTIVEFSDFQCPFCRKFFIDTFGQLKRDYIDTGKVRLIFRNYPLPFHAAAKPAALAAQCAKDQGKFWEYHDTIFAEQQKKEQDPNVVAVTIDFTATDLKKWAATIGLNTSQFNTCLDSAQHQAKVDADTQAGSDFGVSGTPSFFINGQLIVGAQPFSTFKTAIDAALKK